MKQFRLLVGHRGVGKTSLLRRLSECFPSHVFLDLDQEISRQEEKTIEQIFADSGEESFRFKEQETLASFVSQYLDTYTPVWISVGGGFNLVSLKPELREQITLIWISRKSDETGRIFLDRPRLDPKISALNEYHRRFETRQKIFQQYTDIKYEMLEGLGMFSDSSSAELNELERKFFQSEYKINNFGFTLHQDDLNSPQRWNLIQSKMLTNSFEFLEIRDDLLSESEMREVLFKIPEEKILLAFRKKTAILSSLEFLKSAVNKKIFAVDIDKDLLSELKLHLPFLRTCCSNMILSSHDLQAPWENDHHVFGKNFYFKWSPSFEDFSTLENHLKLIEGKDVSYLPRSARGKWEWFRLLRSSKNRINFLNFGRPSSPDQPSLLSALAQVPQTKDFAAVLGNPVVQSFSPAFHFSFFHPQNLPFFRIEVDDEEWDDAIQLLKKLGLKFAAVTSPLKKKAFHSCKPLGDALLFQSVNTLSCHGEELCGWNTDGIGFSKALDHLGGANVMIWGGGGTRKMLQSLFKKAEMISARNPQITSDHLDQEWLLIWAAPRTSETKLPPKELRLNKIIDLNYVDHSLGKELAAERNISYVSGLKMFIEQAREQQKIWETLL